MNNETTKALETPLAENVPQDRLTHSQEKPAPDNHAGRLSSVTVIHDSSEVESLFGPTARQSPESNLAFHPIHGIYECK